MQSPWRSRNDLREAGLRLGPLHTGLPGLLESSNMYSSHVQHLHVQPENPLEKKSKLAEANSLKTLKTHV